MKTKHRILSVLTILALVASLTAVMAAPAGASVFALFPSSGPTGTSVRIFGSGFPVNTVGELTSPGVIARTVFMTTTAGTIDITVTILADAPVGPATFAAAVPVGAVPATATFTVTVLPPAITLVPTSGVPGTPVTVTGVRFPANAAGVIAAPGVITPVTFLTTAAGAIPATTVTILPGAPAGAQILTATVGAFSDTADFIVIPVPAPTITLAPTSGPRLTSVPVTGSGFPADAPGIITAPGVITPVTFTTTPAGAIPATTLTILGDAPFGLATITATVGVASASAFFNVTPAPAATITPLLPTAGARGTVVIVAGSGFPATTPGTPGVIMGPGVIAPIGFIATTGGAIPAGITVTILPDAPFGAATLTVTVGVVSATAPFTVHAPSTTVSPVGGVPGATVTVAGTGFPPGTSGTITAPGVISPIGFTTTAAGRIPRGPAYGEAAAPTVTILLGAPLGPATITVTVDPPGPPPAVTATATYTVGITPTITVSPTIGFEGTDVRVSGHGFPATTSGTVTAAGVITTATFTTTAAGTLPEVAATLRRIIVGAPVGPATITVTVGAVTATAVFTVAGPGVPIIIPEPVVPVLKGLEVIRAQLGEAVWNFRDGRWFRWHPDPALNALIPVGVRLTELRSGEAYWIYLTAPITNVMIGGVLRTLPAGWHNIGWVL